jgi:peroxiredoxin
MLFGSKQDEFRNSIDSMLKFHAPLESYFVLFNFMEEQDFQKIKALKIRMEPKDIKSSYYADLKTIYDNNKLLEIGEMAPEISLPQVDGSILKLSDLRGKIVLIDFWASWCGPCRAEFPNVKNLYARFQSKGFEIYGVSLDKDRASWVSSISSLGLTWKHVSDLKFWACAPAKTYKVSGIPFTVLIDKEGKIIAKNLRGDDLEKKLEELFP